MSKNIGLIPGDLIAFGDGTGNNGATFLYPGERGLGSYKFDETQNARLQQTYSAAVSPNNLILLTSNLNSQTVDLTPIDGGPTQTVPGTPSGPGRVAWAPDGSEFAVTYSEPPYIVRYDATTLAPLPNFLSLPSETMGTLAYHPNKTYLAAAVAFSSAATVPQRFFLWDLVTGEEVSLDGAPLLAANANAVAFSPNGKELFAIPFGSNNNQFIARVYDLENLGSVIPISIPPIEYQGRGTNSRQPAVYSPLGDKLAYGRAANGIDRNFTVINSDTYDEVFSIPDKDPRFAVALHWLTNDVLAVYQVGTGGRNGLLSVYDFSSGEGALLRRYPEGPNFGRTLTGMNNPGPTRFFAGTVKDGVGGPLQRTLRVVERTTGRLIATGESDPVDGSFRIPIYTTNPCIVYALGAGSELTQVEDAVIAAPPAP